MKSVKVEDRVAEKVKDFKAYIRAREKLSVTEAQILSQAFELAYKHYDELVERLKMAEGVTRDGLWDFFLKKPVAGKPTDAAKDHDVVGL